MEATQKRVRQQLEQRGKKKDDLDSTAPVELENTGKFSMGYAAEQFSMFEVELDKYTQVFQKLAERGRIGKIRHKSQVSKKDDGCSACAEINANLESEI